MPLNIGTTAAKKVFWGTNEIKKIFSGTNKIWQSTLTEFDVFTYSKIFRFNTETNTEVLSTNLTGYSSSGAVGIFYNDDYYYLVQKSTKLVTVINKQTLAIISSHRVEGSTYNPSFNGPSFHRLNSKYIILYVSNSNGGTYRLDVTTMTSQYAHYGDQYSTQNVDDNRYVRYYNGGGTYLSHATFPTLTSSSGTAPYSGSFIYIDNYLYVYGRTSSYSSNFVLQKINLTSGNYESNIVSTGLTLNTLISTAYLYRDGDYLFYYRDYTTVQPSTSKIYIWHISQIENLTTTNYYARINVDYTLKSKPEIVGDELYFYEYNTTTEATSLRRYTFGSGDLTLIATYSPSVFVGWGSGGYALANKNK